MKRKEIPDFIAAILKLREGASDELALEATFAYPEWKAGETYRADERIRCGDTLYRVIPPSVTAIETQPPNANGMLAVYRPIVPEHSGAADDPIPFVSGMDVYNGKYYSCDGAVYLAKADMIPCVWGPDTGIWQWEKREEETAN